MIGFDALEHASRTDVGVRRSHNQDALGELLAADAARWREHGHLFIVADGMGGHAVGEKASAKAVRDIPHLVPKYLQEGPAEALRKAYLEANSGIHSIGQENPEFRGLGTTATTLWLRPEGAWIAHVGDSRLYRLRGGMLEQLTFDHSALWEIAKRQGIRPDQLQGVRSNVILRSLGPEMLVEVDVEGPHPLQPGDTFLLCSDGLSGQLSDYEIGAIMETLPPQEACDFLVELANLRGGPDNVTVMIVRVGGEPQPSAVVSKHDFTLAKIKPHWPVAAMLVGLVMAVIALSLLAADWPGGTVAFALAALALAAGLGGLILQTRRQKADEENAIEPPKLHIYARTRCIVEQPLIEKLGKAEAAVREKLPEEERTQLVSEVQPQIDEAASRKSAGDLPGSFRAHCRAMHALVRRFNQLRHKEEVFSPVWDKHG